MPRTGHLCAIVVVAMLLAAGWFVAIGAPNANAATATSLWSLTGPMTIGHGNAGMATLLDGRAIAATGDAGGSLSVVSETFDPATGQWTRTGDVNQPRAAFGNPITLNSGKVLIAGGTDATASSDYSSAELYDPATGQWAFTGSLNTSRRYPIVVKLQDGRVLVATGAHGVPDGNRFQFTSELYDPATGQWSYTGNVNLARDNGAGVVLHNGSVLILGGEGPWLTLSPNTEIYDPATGAWTPTGSLPYGLFAGALVVLSDGRVLLAGGASFSQLYADAEIYDPRTGTWTATGSLPQPRSGDSAVLLPDGRVLLAGGGNGTSPVLPAEIYDPNTGQWSLDATPNSGHGGGRMLRLGNGQVLLTGGYGSSGPTTASEVYTAQADFTWTMANRLPTGTNGVITYPSDINPSSLTVNFNACQVGGATRFDWVLPTGVFSSGPNCTFSASVLKGSQQVTLRAWTGSNVSTVTKTVNVRDVLIASIGDSYASGEANPDVNGACDQPLDPGPAQRTPCTREPTWQTQFPSSGFDDNLVCHRSTRADGTRAAVNLINAHQQVAVTYLHTACSGATIGIGLLGPQVPTDVHTGSMYRVPPQLAQLNRARSGRAIDALVISIGGNDIGFKDILQLCIKAGVDKTLNPKLFDCGDAQLQLVVSSVVQIGLNMLDTQLDRLAACVGSQAPMTPSCPSSLSLGVGPGHVFLMGYPDLARGDDGSLCDGFPLRSAAWAFAESQILQPLNQKLFAKAHQYGWNMPGAQDQTVNPLVVDYDAPGSSSATSYQRHGYCARDTWIRPFLDNTGNTPGDQQLGSYSIQGDRNGVFHPNREGHNRIAQTLQMAIEAKLY